jgi:hypothetical protein
MLVLIALAIVVFSRGLQRVAEPFAGRCPTRRRG